MPGRIWGFLVSPIWIGFLLNAAIESSRVFIPLLTVELGGSSFDVGLVGAASGLAYFVTALVIGPQADSLGRLRFVRVGLAGSALAFLGQLLARDVASLLAVRTAVGLALGITTGSLVVLAYEDRGGVGKFSSMSSLGWIFGATAAALLKECELLFLFSFVVCTVAFLISLKLEEWNKLRLLHAPRSFPVFWRNRAVYLPFFLRHLGASAVWIIFPLYLQELGADRFWIGMVGTANYAGQVVLMTLVERYAGTGLFRLGLCLSGAVFLLYTALSHFMQVLPVHVMLSAAWSTLYIGALVLLLRSGEERATATGILVANMNLCFAAGPFLGGVLSSLWGYHAPMYAAAALSFAGLFWAPRRDGRRGAGA
ncbi:MAG TPA: MFS transporter [Desulfotomaculum sp.]|nr:MFS transporter [Desulfotomaculum sp.]